MKKFVKETSKKLATGALALLATIGSASATSYGDLTNGAEIDLTEASTGTIPVYGYQTAKVYNYNIKVSWGHMKFIFDRGVYNTSTNQLTKRVKTAPWTYCEAQAAYYDNTTQTWEGLDGAAITGDQGVGYWCGFDGENNQVKVENLGNGNVGLGVGCTEGASTGATSSHLGEEVDLQLAVPADEIHGSTDPSTRGWVIPDSGVQDVTMNVKEDSTITPTSMKLVTGTGTVANTVIQRKFDLDGTAVSTEGLNDRDTYVEFYLNITGTPSQSSTDATANASQLDVSSETTPDISASTPWERLGSINLSFTLAQDTPAPVWN